MSYYNVAEEITFRPTNFEEASQEISQYLFLVGDDASLYARWYSPSTQAETSGHLY